MSGNRASYYDSDSRIGTLFQNNSSSRESEFQNNIIIQPNIVDLPLQFYSNESLAFISGTAETIYRFTSPNDIIIMPGRSMIQVARYLEQYIEKSALEKRKIFVPSFSKGGLVIFSDKDDYKKYFDENEIEANSLFKEVYEQVKPLTEVLISSTDSNEKNVAVRKILSIFENNIFYYYDFKQNEIKKLIDLKVDKTDISAYRTYLNSLGLNPQALNQCEGRIHVMDTILSGDSLKVFLNILQNWAADEGVDISKKICIWNFGKEITSNPLANGNLIVSDSAWTELSYNYILDDSTFFPPWAWQVYGLLQPNLSNKIKEQYEEMANFIERLNNKTHSTEITASQPISANSFKAI